MTTRMNDNAYPGTTVVAVRAFWIAPDGSIQEARGGSGLLVGRNDVLTASHVIFNSASGKRADRIEAHFSFSPNESRSEAYGLQAANAIHFKEFDLDKDGLLYTGDRNPLTMSDSEMDIALLSFSIAVGDAFGWLGLNADFTSGAVEVMGYPASGGNSLQRDDGTAWRDPVDATIRLNQNLEIRAGNSGGPIVAWKDGMATVVGIVSTQGAAASVKDHLDWIVPEIARNDAAITGYVPLRPDGQSRVAGLEITDTSSDAVITKSIHRFFNTEKGGHFYTSSAQEAAIVRETLPHYRYEGVGFTATSGAEDEVSVFRLFNKKTGMHLYTSSLHEANTVLRTLPEFTYEGVSFHAYANRGEGRDGVFRFFNTVTGVHLFTTSEVERDHVQGTLPEFRFEGIAFYVDAVL
ncbi:trypsin-like peptidase domain-containing protein [Sabulicella rubraurantiaca]|uniref:trypsin-like peptidase domain-containing protein n=1 Tax=Sabulicella rubraurantiaca TaxID=2811429 RepID=UPI001A97B267|nr:trypsin-like peptidase domain-containing protein [Sabulicella rubraurantiaca]